MLDVSRSKVLAMISHELRTPIAGISGSLEVLGNTKLDDMQAGMVALAKDSLDMVRSILDDILDYSKIEAGVMRINPGPTNIRAVVDHVYSVMRPLAEKKGLKIRSRVGRGVGQIHLVDELRLKQVLLNLVGNAIKFTGSGHIEIEVDSFDVGNGCEGVVILVADTGVGIADDHMGSIFNPFFQAGVVEDKRQSGAGLGLNICQHLISLMSGSLSCESKPGSGTVFRVEVVLPVLNLDLEDESNNKEVRYGAVLSSESSKAGGRKILIAGGGIGGLLVELSLDVMGISYDVVSGAADALAAVGSGGYGLLIVSCDVSDRDGYALIEEVRRREGVSCIDKLPVVVLAGEGVGGREEELRSLGEIDFVQRPAEFSSINEIVSFWLSIPRLGPGSAGVTERIGLSMVRGAECWVPDVKKLLEAYGSVVVVRRIMNNLVDNSLLDIGLLRAAISNGDAGEVRRRLHRIAGSMAFVGYVPYMDSIYVLIRKVEDLGVESCKNLILRSIGEIVCLVNSVSSAERSLDLVGT